MAKESTLCLLIEDYKDAKTAADEIVADDTYWHHISMTAGGRQVYGETGIEILYRADPYNQPAYIETLLPLLETTEVSQVRAGRGISSAIDVSGHLRQESFILLVEVKGRVFAYCTGIGSLSIPFGMSVGDFGLRAVLQEVDHDKYRELAVREPGRRGYIRDEKLNQAGRAHRFTLSTYYGSLKRVVGEITKDKKTKKLEGAQGVKVDWPSNRAMATSAAEAWLKSYQGNKPLPTELADICSIQELTKRSEITTCLISLYKALKAGDDVDLGIISQIPEEDDTGKYLIHYCNVAGGRKDQQKQIHTLEPSDWQKSIQANLSEEAFLHASVGLDPSEPKDAKHLIMWITACFKHPTKGNYVVDGGNCYIVQEDFITRLAEDVNKICNHFQTPHSTYAYKFKAGENEYHLNKDFCKQNNFKLLDEAEYRLKVDGSPIELCDSFDASGNMFVCKRYSNADSVVKTVSQALDAAEALRSSGTYWKDLSTLAKLSTTTSPVENPEQWRFVLMFATKKSAPLSEQLTFKGKLEMRRFREDMGRYNHPYGILQVQES